MVYALTRQGRVETTNYQTVRLPTGMQLRALSVFWLDADPEVVRRNGGGTDVFVTRLHSALRRSPFPGRPGVPADGRPHQFPGSLTLASLTGWSVDDVRRKMPTVSAPKPADERPWWERLW